MTQPGLRMISPVAQYTVQLIKNYLKPSVWITWNSQMTGTVYLLFGWSYAIPLKSILISKIPAGIFSQPKLYREGIVADRNGWNLACDVVCVALISYRVIWDRFRD